MKQYLINESDLKPAPEQHKKRSAGINVGYWEDWERTIPFADRTFVARPDGEGRIYLATHQQGPDADSAPLHILSASEGAVPFGGEWEDESLRVFRPDFTRNVGVKLPEKGGFVRSFFPIDTSNPTGIDLQWADDAAPFSWLRFMLPLRTNTEKNQRGLRKELHNLEYISSLCRVLGKRPWITVHHTWEPQALRSIADMFRGQDLIFEFSNEPWHPGWAAGKHYTKVGMEKYGETDPKKALGPRLWAYAEDAQQAFEAARAMLGKEVTCVAGAQWTNPWTTAQILKHCQPDAIAVAPYFGGKAGRADYPDPSVENMRFECSLQVEESYIVQKAEEHRSHGVDLMVYECGPHVFPVGQVSEEHRARMVTFNRSRAMHELMTEFLASLEAANLEPTFFCLHKSQLNHGDAAFAGNEAKMGPVREWLGL